MRRLHTFDMGEKSYHLHIAKAHPNVISGGSPGRIRKIATFLDKDYELIESDRGLVTVNGEYKGMPITAFSTGMGPASVSITLPEIIEACEDDDMFILRIGTTGGLQSYLKVGDFIVSTEIERSESTSDKIMGKEYIAKADQVVIDAISHAAAHNRLEMQNVYVGKTRVTDDIYFDLKVNKPAEDVLSVSMEFSVYCALRDRYNIDQKRDIKVGNLLLVSDVIGKEEAIDVSEFKDKQQELEAAHIKSGLEALYSLRNK